MSHAQFTLSTTVSVEPQIAYAFLVDLNNHRHLHPFFVEAKSVATGTTPVGFPYEDFMITERPRFAFFHYTINFPTRMILSGENEFRSEVEAALGTKLSNVMRCEKENGRTRITETVTINAPWFIINYVKRQAYHAHSQTFTKLPGVLAKLYATQ